MELPELSDQLLDPETIRAWFADLAACADVREVRLKGPPGTRPLPGTATLAGARDAWEEGSIHAVQVRYHYEGAGWMDTLMRAPQGGRIVRMQAS